MRSVEIVHILPKEGALERLLALRPQIISDYKGFDPTVTAELYKAEDGSIIDIWTWGSREIAEAALADDSISNSFQEWLTLVDLISLKWAEPLTT